MAPGKPRHYHHDQNSKVGKLKNELLTWNLIDTGSMIDQSEGLGLAYALVAELLVVK